MTEPPKPAEQQPPLLIRRLTQPTSSEQAQLRALLIDCVAGGASVGFMWPLTPARAQSYWEGIAASAARGERVLIVVEQGSLLVGSAQLVFAVADNQPHRADVAKMLVLRSARRRGVGAALLRAIEAVARETGRNLLVLDTASEEAARLYERCGWQRCGRIPRYALWPDGAWCDTTVYYRVIDAPAEP